MSDYREYDNDYTDQKAEFDRYGQRTGSKEPVVDDKPLSASDITAIAESTVNQLLMRDDRRGRGRRSRSRSRSRNKSRGRSRSRERRRSPRAERSPVKERGEKQPDKTTTMSRLEKLKDPRIVTLKGLQNFHKESDIRRKLVDERMRFRDIRVIFNKANQSGTAFVEFYSEAEAARWVRHNRGMLKVNGEHLTMDLNKPLAAPKKDWVCEPCGEKNHYARESCYSCQSEKQEAPEKPRLRSKSPDEDRDGKNKDVVPSNVLMFRGLDYRTTEDQIHRKLRDLTDLPIKDVRLITDKYTNKSRGFCFVEVSSVADGKKLMTRIESLEPQLEIGSRRVTVTYQREPGQTNQAADMALAAAQWSATPKQTADEPTTPQTDAAATMPQSIGSYVWDEKSGYYYDQASGLYYDPKTKYYYNPTDEKYYYWNTEANKYDTVVAANSTPHTTDPTTIKDGSVEKTKISAPPTTNSNNKATKAMNAKKIQKDMERWAKAKNRQQAKANPAPKAEPEPIEDVSSVQSGNSIALKIAQDYADPVYQQSQQPNHQAPPPPSIFPISNMNQPAAMTDDQINMKYEDLAAIACLLCKRKFPSVDNLKRHQELSDLHKTSLAAERQKLNGSGFSAADAASVLDYRDRALERRQKFGPEMGAPPNKFVRR